MALRCPACVAYLVLGHEQVDDLVAVGVRQAVGQRGGAHEDALLDQSPHDHVHALLPDEPSEEGRLQEELE
jgi:hypothetical protein